MMNKSWIIARHEIVNNITRRSWMLITFGVPLLLSLILFGRSVLLGPAPAADSAPSSSPGLGTLVTEGYVDHSGVIQSIPAAFAGKLIAYPNEESARQALQSGDIPSYYIIPEDYVQSGDVIYVDPDYKGFAPEGQSWIIRRTLLVNLLGGDMQLAAQVEAPADLTVTALNGEVESEERSGWQFTIPYATCMILYFMTIMSSSLLRSSVGNERKNRVMEVLMLSVPPRQMLMGKMVGLAVVGLLQTLVWATAGYMLTRWGGQALSLPPGVQIPISLVAWILVFFLLGYALYATLLAGLGALTGPNEMGSSTADVAIIWPMIIPMFFIAIIIEQPGGLIAVALSIFPLTAPVAMVTRLATGTVPIWQPLLAAGLMAISAALVMRAVARVFRAQVLLSGQPFSLRGYFSVLLGQA